MGEVRDGDEAVALPVKHAEGLPDLLLDVIVMDLSRESGIIISIRIMEDSVISRVSGIRENL